MTRAVLTAMVAAGIIGGGSSHVLPSSPGPRVALTDPEVVAEARFSLPLPRSLLDERALRAPHHDYPASDLMVPVGTPVFASHAGVATTHDGRRCGLGVTIRSSAGYRSVSCHLSLISIPDGAHVKAGDVVGLSGDTGNAVGVPHLHFHLLDRDGRYVCPQPLFLAWWRHLDRSPIDRPLHTGCAFPRDRAT